MTVRPFLVRPSPRSGRDGDGWRVGSVRVLCPGWSSVRPLGLRQGQSVQSGHVGRSLEPEPGRPLPSKAVSPCGTSRPGLPLSRCDSIPDLALRGRAGGASGESERELSLRRPHNRKRKRQGRDIVTNAAEAAGPPHTDCHPRAAKLNTNTPCASGFGAGGRTSRRRALGPQRVPARTNCWVDPTLCLVIRSDKRRTLREQVGGLSQKGYPMCSATTGTLFGCGPRPQGVPVDPAFRNTVGRGRDEHLGAELLLGRWANGGSPQPSSPCPPSSRKTATRRQLSSCPFRRSQAGRGTGGGPHAARR